MLWRMVNQFLGCQYFNVLFQFTFWCNNILAIQFHKQIHFSYLLKKKFGWILDFKKNMMLTMNIWHAEAHVRIIIIAWEIWTLFIIVFPILVNREKEQFILWFIITCHSIIFRGIFFRLSAIMFAFENMLVIEQCHFLSYF